MTEQMGGPTLLICTVGGTPQAVAASITAAGPERVIFVVSPETAKDVEAVVGLAGQSGVGLGAGQFDHFQIPDAQDLTGCVEKMRELGVEVKKWIGKGPDYRVLADFTGGTKCMSAALALTARRWPCRFSYVGGEERTKGGTGVVVNGKERARHTQNPWDALGFQAVEEAASLFNGLDYQATAHVLEGPLGNAGLRPDVRRELATFKALAEAYLAWDCFKHGEALNKLREVLRNANDIRHLFPRAAGPLLTKVGEHLEFLGKVRANVPDCHTIEDLLANAVRCGRRGRYDDAVARLYRSLEALAQIRLSEKHGIPDTGCVQPDKITQELLLKWHMAEKKGPLALGLQRSYELLLALGDDVGKRFGELGLDGPVSLLNERNQSILAHGFKPVGEKVYSKLRDAALALAGRRESELLEFPQVPSVYGT